MDAFSLTYNGDNYIQIGCECHTFANWKKNGLKIIKKHDLDLYCVQIKEYKLSFKYLEDMIKLRKEKI
jgi:hypothetical protein